MRVVFLAELLGEFMVVWCVGFVFLGTGSLRDTGRSAFQIGEELLPGLGGECCFGARFVGEREGGFVEL